MAEPLDASEQLAWQLMQLELKEVQSGLKGKGEYCRQFFAQPNRENRAAGTATQTEPKTAAAAGPSGQSTASSAASTPLSTPATSVVEAADDGQPESSKSAASRTQETSVTADDGLEQVCAACSEPLGDELAVSAPCGHNYCPDCLTCLFESATTDESLFPPRCCKQPIPLDATRKWLPEELIIEFERKALEFTTLDRTYCSNVQCSLFIPPRQIVSDRGYCESCEQWTCTICKSPEHGGMCPDDPCRAEILAVAKENGWQQCYGCKRLVELNVGCNHMSKYNSLMIGTPTNLTEPTGSLPLRESVLGVRAFLLSELSSSSTEACLAGIVMPVLCEQPGATSNKHTRVGIRVGAIVLEEVDARNAETIYQLFFLNATAATSGHAKDASSIDCKMDVAVAEYYLCQGKQVWGVCYCLLEEFWRDSN
ncbi:IBR finger domain-containing protein [Cordyceps javanica]|uniref:IBR finger domain-containing protein n=1 Tax=Cordyceps javanica TaxID=43265 RepID=A0A545VSW3_9HYPO|nr:IBR finger domain-containing protein [Cordyceps javanica]TQW04822.1 IBR finger domain protein [Cordyceps javanica]